MEILSKVYDYFLHGIDISKVSGKNKNFTAYEYNKFVSKAVFDYLLELFDYKNNPKLLTEKDYESLSQKELFHGFRKSEHGLEFLVSDNYHTGEGFTGGLFLTNLKEEASNYTENYKTNQKDEEKILSAKILSNNIVDYYDLKKLRTLLNSNNNELNQIKLSDKLAERLLKIKKLHELLPQNINKDKFVEFYIFMENLKTDDFGYAFLQLFMDNLSSLAIVLGYDAIVYEKNENGFVGSQQGDYYILLNREKLAVSESELKKFKEASAVQKTIESNSQMGDN